MMNVNDYVTECTEWAEVSENISSLISVKCRASTDSAKSLLGKCCVNYWLD